MNKLAHPAISGFRLASVLCCPLVSAANAANGAPLLLRDRQQIILLGDSLTEGEDPDGYVNTVRVLLAKACPEITVFTANAGTGGNNSADLNDRLQRDALQFKPDWVTISIGVNDINQRFGNHPLGDSTNGIGLPAFKQKVTELVRRIQAQNGKVVLFTGTVIKEDLSSLENQQMELYSAALREVRPTPYKTSINGSKICAGKTATFSSIFTMQLQIQTENFGEILQMTG